MSHSQKTLFKFFSLLGLALAFLPANAQKTIVRGHVFDPQSQESLVPANVVFTGTTTGTYTDIDGRFILETEAKGITSITVSYLGYKTQVIAIQESTEQLVTVAMQADDGVEIEVVEVKAERPKKDTAAIALFRRVVANKDKNNVESSFDYLQYENYVKTEFDLYNVTVENLRENKILKKFEFVLENVDTAKDGTLFLPALLRETISDIYHDRRDGINKEIVKAEQFSGIQNVSVGEIVDYSFDDVNIYDNLITISGKNFVGPFAPGALASYRYFLNDSAIIDGEKCYQLFFSPHPKTALAFNGTAWIEDKTAAVKSVNLDILEKANLNYVNDFSLSQSFVHLDGKNWFKNKEVMFVSMNISKNKNKGSFRIVKSSSRDNVVLQRPEKQVAFSGDNLERLGDAGNKDDKYWAEHRHEKLSNTEEAIYKTVDSVQSTRTYKTYAWLTYLGTTAMFRAGPIEFGRFYKFVSWNNIEGVRLRFGGRSNMKLSKWFQFMGYGAYGLKDKEWKYLGTFRTHLPRVNERRHFLTLEYRYDLTQLASEDETLTHDNIASSVFRFGKPLSKILKERAATIMYERDWLRTIRSTFTAQHRIFYSIPGTVEFRHTVADTSYSVQKFTTMEFKVKTVFGKQKFLETNYDRYPITFDKPLFSVEYTAGVKGILGSEFNYHKVELELSQRLGNFLGRTDYSVYVGKMFGTAPYTFQFIPKGNQSYLRNKFSFNVMNEFEYVCDEWAGVSLEHHFNGLMLNHVPLLNKLKWREIIIAKFLAGRLTNRNQIIDLPVQEADQPNSFTMSDLNGYYAEVGFGIENIFKLFRVDFLWRLTQRDKADIMPWGVRFALQPSF